MKRLFLLQVLLLITLIFAAVGCGTGPSHEAGHEADEMPQLHPADLKAGEKLRVVATTSIVADVVQQVGGDLIELATLLPVGADPHTFEPTPQDAAALAGAHVVFINGAGLELFLEDLLESAGEGVMVVPVSHGIELLKFEGEAEGEEEEAEHHHHGDTDPHVWFDPQNVSVWVNNIEQALVALDPGHAEAYKAGAKSYRAELERLDGWIEEMVAQVPQENRKLVVDHRALAYFARRYGFEQVGTVFPGYSTLTEPSAQELAALEEAIRGYNVRAIFVSTTVNPALAERVARDTGTKLVFLYTGSLSDPGGPADSYISFMKYNTGAIVNALR